MSDEENQPVKFVIPEGGVSVLDFPVPEFDNGKGAKFKAEVKKFRRGAMADQPFLGLETLTAENLQEYIEFRGLDYVLETLEARENLNCQAALQFSADSEDKKTPDGKGQLRVLIAIDQPKLVKAIATNTCRGETIKELQAKIDEITKELSELAVQFDVTNPDTHLIVKMKGLGMKLKGYQEQKEARSKKRLADDDEV